MTEASATDTACSSAEFDALVDPLRGEVISLAWRGFGSALFLELGALRPDASPRRHPRGAACIDIEWDWRVEGGDCVLYGSSNSGPEIDRAISGLVGTTLQSLTVEGEVPELVVVFSDGRRLRSMAMVDGDPQWSVRLADERRLYVTTGTLRVGVGAASTALSNEEANANERASSAAARWGRPSEDPVRGNCRDCDAFVRLDAEGPAFLDYGVCTSPDSVLDGRAVHVRSGCAAHIKTT